MEKEVFNYMTKIDLPQILDLNEKETNDYIDKLIKMDDFKPLDNINIASHKDQIITPQLESYPHGTFSELALNFFIDKKLMDLFPLFEKLNTYYENLVPNYNFNEDVLSDIENLINTTIDGFKPLKVFHFFREHSFDIKNTYEVYMMTDEKERFIKYLKKIIKSILLIADSIVCFYEVFYDFSKELITLRSKIYTDDIGLAFDDYFLQENLSLLSTGNKKYFIPVLSREVYRTSEYTNVQLPNEEKKSMVESIIFNDYASLLQYDYFKALEFGHTVRICRNCNRAFLQTTKAHTIYCDRIYKDTDKTCRQYGPTKFHKERVENSPIHILYTKCKKKVDTRKFRLIKKYEEKNLPVPREVYDTHNQTIAHIMGLQEQALDGKITVIELESLYKAI